MWSADRDVSNVLEGRAPSTWETKRPYFVARGPPPCRPRQRLNLAGCKGAEADIRRAAAGVFALTQHNYLSPKVAYRDAQPIRDLDRELEQRVAMEVRGLR